MEKWFTESSAWLVNHPQWLGWAILLTALTECLAIVGLLVPGSVALFALAVVAGSSVLELWQALLLGFIGGLLGDLLSYMLGRKQHQNIRRLPYLRSHPQWLGGAEQYFNRYGGISLLIGRFIGPLRPLLPMVAGMLDMPLLRFVLISMLSAAGWSLAYVLPGWVTGAALRLQLPEQFWSQVVVVVAGLALLIGVTVQCSVREYRHTAALAGGLGLLLVIALLFGWPHLTAVDQGLLDLMQSLRKPQLDSLFLVFTCFGDLPIQRAAGILLVLLLLLMRQSRAALFAGSSLLLAALANALLKQLIGRARPVLLAEPLTSFSLPSGHSSAAFAFCLVLGILAGRGQPGNWRATWLLLASLPALGVALSRVYLGVHWPTDILAGSLLAAASCAGCLALVQRRELLPALGARVWRLLLPACVALFCLYAVWSLPAALEVYRLASIAAVL